MEAGRRRRGRTGVAATAALTAVLMALPAAGQAATVSIAQGQARYQAAAGEDNAVTVSYPAPETVVFTEAGAGVTVADGSPADTCTVTGEQATCTAQTADVQLGDLDDSATAAGAGVAGVRMDGGEGDDSLIGGNGHDSLYGSMGNDTLDGGPGEDGSGLLEWSIWCGVDGGPGDDEVAGGDGNDSVCGGMGTDTLRGGDGTDLLNDGDRSGSAGEPAEPRTVDADVIDGGPGEGDAVSYRRTRAVRLTLGNAVADDGEVAGGGLGAENDTLIGVEGAATGSGDDEVTGSDAPNLIFGFEGDDTVTTFDGRDVIEGGEGDDDLDGGDGGDAIDGDKGDDTVEAGPGDDGYFHVYNTECFYRDGITGGPGDDVVSGGAGNDGLCGGGGTDTLLGGDGHDGLRDDDVDRFGPPGNIAADTLDGGTGIDTVSYDRRVRPVRLTLGAGVADDGTIAGDGFPAESDTVLAVENAVLGEGADEVVGSAGDNFVQGGLGADRMTGGEGFDVLFGGDGDDVLAGEAGPDGLRGDAGRDDLSGGDGADNLVADDQEADHVACGADADTIAVDPIDAVDADCERPPVDPGPVDPGPVDPGPGEPTRPAPDPGPPPPTVPVVPVTPVDPPKPEAREAVKVSCRRASEARRGKVRIRCRVKTARRGRAVLRRGGRIVARATIRRGRFSVRVPARGGRARAGRYTLTVATGRGSAKRVATERVKMR